MSEQPAAPARRLHFRTWPVLALAMLGLLGLIAVSLFAARSKAENAYTQLDNLNSRYRDIESRLRRLRSDLQLSGILIRDHLLDPHPPTTEYRSRLLELRAESDRMIAELAPLLGQSDPAATGFSGAKWTITGGRTSRCFWKPTTWRGTTCSAVKWGRAATASWQFRRNRSHQRPEPGRSSGRLPARGSASSANI
jgi:hypothetical protein